MAVTGSQPHSSKKSRHKKSSGENNDMPKKTTFNNAKTVSVSEELDESETDLDKPQLNLPHHSRGISSLQIDNGNTSDSETDVDKPPKMTVVHKSVAGTQNVKSRSSTQTASQRSDEEEDDSESDEEPQSMSLLQMHSAKLSPEKKSNQHNINIFLRSGNNNLRTGGAVKGTVVRKPNVSEMSPSESESDTDDGDDRKPNHHSRPGSSQPQPESESEDEPPPKVPQINQWTRAEQSPESDSEDEQEGRREGNQNQYHHSQQLQQRTVASENPVRIKQEVDSGSSSFEEDDPPSSGEFQNSPHLPLGESMNVSSLRKSVPENPSGIVLNTNHLNDIATFEREHTRVSAPVIDIPQDSRVWVLQVPRSIKASEFYGQCWPTKLKGGEVLNLPSGSWRILDQPYEASRSTLNCILSTGNFCYGMRWLQPRGFRYLKRIRTPLPMETADVPWKQEIGPLPIKELLKMKSNPAISKGQHLKPSRKRRRDSDLDLPSKRLKTVITNEGVAEKGKKRKRNSESNEVSSSKKKKNDVPVMMDDKPRLDVTVPQTLGASVADVNRSSDKKEKKNKSKHKDTLIKSNSPVLVTKGTHENTANDSEWREHSSLPNFSGSTSYKKKKKHKTSHVEQEEEVKQNESSEIAEKKKKRKHRREEESVQTFQAYENKIKSEPASPTKLVADETEKQIKKGKKKHSQLKNELASPTKFVSDETEKQFKKEKKKHNEKSVEDSYTDSRKKKKHKHHNRMEGEGSVEKSKEDSPVKKKKKHKHKASDEPKVKQEGFWERETSPDFLNRLFLTQATPEDV